MMRGERIYVWVLAALILAAVLLEVLGPKPLDWTRSFERVDDRPYGSEIVFAAMPYLFEAVDVTRDPPYLVLDEMPASPVNWCFITYQFASDLAEVNRLVQFVEAGNTVFIAAEQFGGALPDTLGFAVREDLIPPFVDGEARADSVRLRILAEEPKVEYAYKMGTIRSYFNRYDTGRTTVLGRDHADEATLLQVPVGQGQFVLSTTPLAFTNYYMLHRENAQYAYQTLSYLPESVTWWDSHYKPLRVLAATPLRYILSVPSLKTAYAVGMFALLLFVVFRAKRTQRPIPIVTPLRNDTLDFIKTVGRLYYQRSDHADLAHKRITYFFEYLRSHLGVATNHLDDALVRRVAQRSDIPHDRMIGLFAHIKAVEKAGSITPDQLKNLSEALEHFYRDAKR